MRYIVFLETILALFFLLIVQLVQSGVSIARLTVAFMFNLLSAFYAELAAANDTLTNIAVPAQVKPGSVPMSETGVENDA